MPLTNVPGRWNWICLRRYRFFGLVPSRWVLIHGPLWFWRQKHALGGGEDIPVRVC